MQGDLMRLITLVPNIIQTDIKCLKVTTLFSRSMWHTTHLTHRGVNWNLPRGQTRFHGWVQNNREVLKKIYIDFISQINLTIGNIVSDAEMRRLYSDSGNLYIEFCLMKTTTSGVFKLEDFWAERSERQDACCTEPFAEITWICYNNWYHISNVGSNLKP